MEAYNVESNYETSVRDSQTTGPLPSFPDQSGVVFQLACRTVYTTWLLDDVVTSTHIKIDDLSYTLRYQATVATSLRDFMISCDEAHHKIQESVSGWPIWVPRREEIICHVIKKTREAATPMPPSDRHLTMNVHIEVSHCVYLRQPQSMESSDGDEEGFTDSYEVHMVPCDESAIGELVGKRVIVSTDSQNCSVCLEGFPQDFEAASLPCGHLFHEDCIVLWLKTSHYCPVCRYQMPVSN